MSDAPLRTPLLDLLQYPLGTRIVRVIYLWFLGMLGYGMWLGSAYVSGIAVGGAIGVLIGRLTAMANPEEQLPETDTKHEINL